MDTAGPSIEILLFAAVICDSVSSDFGIDDSTANCSRSLSFSAINCSWFDRKASISSLKCKF